jgi:hypothetical protein
MRVLAGIPIWMADRKRSPARGVRQKTLPLCQGPKDIKRAPGRADKR